MDRRRVLRILNSLVALGLAFLVVWTAKPWNVWAFEGQLVAAFVGALLIDSLLVIVWAYRHALVLRAIEADIKPTRLVPLVTFSNTANNLTPAASGEVVRAWLLNQKYGIPVDRAGGAIIFERLFMFGLMALTAVAAGLAAIGESDWLVIFGVAAVFAYVLLLPRLFSLFAGNLASRHMRGGRIRRTLKSAATHGVHIWGDRRTNIGTTLWSLAAFACQGGVFWIAAALSDLTLSPTQTWALVGGGTAVGVISALPFGLGAAELTAVGVGTVIGLDAGPVAAAFVLYRLFLTFPLALAGSFFYWRLTSDIPAPSK